MIGLVFAASLVAGTYTYKTSYHGTDLGTSTVTVSTNGGSTQISEQTAGSYSGTSGNANATLLLNSDMTPSSYKASGTMGGSPIADSATISGDTAQVTSAQGVTQSFKLDGQKYFVVVDLGTVSGFIPLPAQMQAWNNASVCAVIPSFGQSVVMSPGAGPAASSRPASVPAGDTALTFTGHTPFTVWYNTTTLVPDEIDVEAQGVVITRTK